MKEILGIRFILRDGKKILQQKIRSPKDITTQYYTGYMSLTMQVFIEVEDVWEDVPLVVGG